MKHARFFSLVIGVLVVLYGAIASYCLPLANFESELTRMGLLPESEFGWRAPQPALKTEWMHQASWQEADVLVIGDSFSDGRVWQTQLTRQGLKVHTEHWTAIRGICEDFMPWLRGMGFRGRYVVLEVVERNISAGLPAQLACQKMQPHFSALANAPRPAPPVQLDREQREMRGRLSIGIETAYSLRAYDTWRVRPDASSMMTKNGVQIRRMQNGCTLFSHRRCEDGLFLAGDRVEDVDVTALESAKKIEARMPDVQVIWAFVPNKSTAYWYGQKQFWARAAQRVNAPNLLAMTQTALKNGMVDLYPANNTHFSTQGYLLMGAEILRALQHPPH